MSVGISPLAYWCQQPSGNIFSTSNLQTFSVNIPSAYICLQLLSAYFTTVNHLNNICGKFCNTVYPPFS